MDQQNQQIEIALAATRHTWWSEVEEANQVLKALYGETAELFKKWPERDRLIYSACLAYLAGIAEGKHQERQRRAKARGDRAGD